MKPLFIYTIKKNNGNITTVVAEDKNSALKKTKGKILYIN